MTDLLDREDTIGRKEGTTKFAMQVASTPSTAEVFGLKNNERYPSELSAKCTFVNF